MARIRINVLHGIAFGIASAMLAGAATPACATGSHYDVQILTKATRNMSFKNGVYSATGDNAILNVTDLTNALSNGNVEVTTGNGSSGNELGDVHVGAGFTWTNGSALTFDAYHSMYFRKAVVDAGTGALTLTNDDGGQNGTITFATGGTITIWNLSNALNIDGQTYTLVGNLPTLASDIAANPAGNYALANAYNAGKDGTYTSSPIQTGFTGRFDGLGNTISNLSISSRLTTTNVGLFEENEGGRISSIVLSSVRIHVGSAPNAPQIYVGAIVGESLGGTVSNVSAIGTMTGSNKYEQEVYAGGLAGHNAGKIVDSTAGINLDWSWAGVGGLVGYNESVISNCHASGSVSGKVSWLAGLVSYNSGTGVIELSSASGNVTYASEKDTTGSQNGGLVGENQGVIDQSWASGNVSGAWVGGLVGVDANPEGRPGVITDSYATGAVLGDEGARGVGGLMGAVQTSSNAVENVYSTGAVSSQKRTLYLGGLVGTDYTSPDLSNTYWDIDTSGITDLSQGAGTPSNDPGITGLTTQQLQSGLPAGFNKKIWAENPGVNDGLPFLIANPPQQ